MQSSVGQVALFRPDQKRKVLIASLRSRGGLKPLLDQNRLTYLKIILLNLLHAL